jgi:glycerophosphoryl diester phosphodiesterase
MLLLGHRGARATSAIPENTIPSFDLALHHGCDGFEFDVRRTSDEHAVICHDPQANGRSIARATRVQLAALPTLEEVLRRYRDKAFLDIELKVAGMEARVLEALRDCPPKKGFVVSSFLPTVLIKIRGLDQTVPLGLIAENRRQFANWRQLPVQYVMVEKKLATQKLTNEVHAEGRELFVWTVNNRKTMMRLTGYGVDGIISDDTELLVHTLSQSPSDASNAAC